MSFLKPSSRQQAAAADYISRTMPRRDQEPIPQKPDSSDDENERQAAEPTFVFEYRLTNIERVLKSRTGLFRTFRGCLIAFWYRKQVKALVALLDGLGKLMTQFDKLFSP